MAKHPRTRIPGHSATSVVGRLFLVACLVVLGSAGCSAASGCTSSSVACLRILFVGNSYTYVNDLPSVFTRLAATGGHPVESETAAVGGATLAYHAGSAASLGALRKTKWNLVILQEQSEIPAIEQFRTTEIYPAARSLVAAIRQTGAAPMFFVTWAHAGGWPENGIPDYETMQRDIDAGYQAIATQLMVPVVPVGEAWSLARARDPRAGLWQSDGSHPTEQGTYLAACVFYAAIFHQSPQGLTYHGNVPDAAAAALQATATAIVLSDPQHWGLWSK